MPDRDLSSTRLLARNALLNLAGKGLPLLVALAAIPLLIQGLGTERFGLLALAWVVIGYFTLFDLGIGRALTQVVSERLGTEREGEVGPIARTGLVGTGLLGLVGGAGLYAAVPFLVEGLLNVPAGLRAESVTAFRILALAVPAVVSTAALRGVLEAEQRFGAINAVFIPMGVLLFLGPVAVLPWTSSLVAVFGVLVAVRIAGWAVFLALTLRGLPDRARGEKGGELAGGDLGAHLAELLRLGGWMTVSNVVSPLMVYFDRFVIGAVLTLSAVTYYATPYEAVTKVLLAPVAVAGVFFPAFALTAHQRRERTGLLFGQSLRAIMAMLFPVVLLVMAFAPEALALWVDAEMAERGTAVARWLAVGVFFNGLAQVPFALVQGSGRPDISAKFHLLEAPLYFALLWLLLGRMGIAGAAVAWSARAALDAGLLSVASARLVPETGGPLLRAAQGTLVACAVFAAAAWLPSVGARAGLTVAVLAVFGAVAWRAMLGDEERAALLRMVRAES